MGNNRNDRFIYEGMMSPKYAQVLTERKQIGVPDPDRVAKEKGSKHR